MHRGPTNRFSSCQYGTYRDIDDSQCSLGFIGVNIHWKISTICLCACILSYAPVLCVFSLVFGRFLDPATAGVESQLGFNRQRDTTGPQKTTTTPQGSLGCGDKVCKRTPVSI